MKLLQLDIENYGLYIAQQFQFGQGFRLIYGPNEAGKSTLLQLIREMLFGFPHHTSFALPQHTGRLAATARIEMADGARLRFRRQKGQTGTVVGEVEGSRTAVDDAMLSRLLGAANGELYQNVFAFSLAELSVGEKSLQHANLNEAMFGSGIGGLANFQRVRKTIQDEHEELYLPRGKRAINRLLTEIRDKNKLLRDTAVKPREYDELRTLCGDQEALVGQLSQKLEDLRQQARQAERLEAALESWLKCEQVRAELAKTEPHPGFPARGAEDLIRAREQLAEIAEELAQLDEELRTVADSAGVAADAGGIRHEETILAREAAIRVFYQEVGRIQRFVTDIPQRQQESETIKQQIEARIVELNPQWKLADLGQFSSSLAQREAVQNLADELTQIKQRDTVLASQRPELDRQKTFTEQRLQELEQVDWLPGLEDLIARSQVYQGKREKQAEARRALDALNNEIQSLAQKLAAPLKQTTLDFAALTLPLPPTVSEHREQLDRVRRAVTDAQRRRDEVHADLTKQQAEMTEFNARPAVADREQLLRQRERRDFGWGLIRRKYLEPAAGDGANLNREIAAWLQTKGATLADPFILARSVSEEFEQEVAAADRLADERQAKADEVAKREHLAAAVARLQSRVDEAETILTTRRQELTSAEQSWVGLWASCGFESGTDSSQVPLSPAAMLEWLRLHAKYIETVDQRRTVETRGEPMREEIERFEAELARALPSAIGSPEASLAEARRRLESARESASERKRLEAELPRLEASLQALDHSLCETTFQQADWQQRWQAMLNDLGFPSGWSVQLVTRILTELADLRLKHVNALALDRRVADMRTELAEFDRQVRALCQTIAADLIELPMQSAVLELNRRLDAAKAGELQRKTLVEARASADRRRELKRQQQSRLEQQIRDCLAATGAASEAEYHRIAQVVERRRQLEEELLGLSRDVNTIRGGTDEAAFVAELRATHRDSIAGRRRRLADEIGLAETAYEKALKEAGATREKLDELDGASRAAQLAAELESSRSEFGAAVDRWAPLVLTSALMRRAIERFEQEHQPRMLLEVSRLFEKMTLGRYVGIQRKLDDQGTLLVKAASGELKDPGSLSTGTREQLYLAIRLAFVLEYCRDSEPLPLVMDDVLVNFDHRRAKQTLDVLIEISRDIQILFLTCHQHMADLVQNALPEIEPIELAPQEGIARLPATRDDPPSRVPPPRGRKPRQASAPAGEPSVAPIRHLFD